MMGQYAEYGELSFKMMLTPAYAAHLIFAISTDLSSQILCSKAPGSK